MAKGVIRRELNRGSLTGKKKMERDSEKNEIDRVTMRVVSLQLFK